MLKYVAAAAALKTLSLSSSFYRALGNTVGARRRINTGLRQQYLDRAKNVFALARQYKLKDGDRLLELGTGWVHWESLIYRLYCDVETVLFDVWDNRQLEPLKRYCAQLESVIDNQIPMDAAKGRRVHQLLRQISAVSSFDELYRLLNWKYVVEPSGKLNKLADGSFNLVYSVNVAEHIQKEIVPGYVKDMHRILAPGGLSIQTIDLTDHLTTQFEKDVSLKNYLKYSDRTWKLLFENNVQYFNRIQAPEWLAYFADAGFELVQDFSEFKNPGPIRIHKQYSHLKPQEIECMTLNVVHRKPHVA